MNGLVFSLAEWIRAISSPLSPFAVMFIGNSGSGKSTLAIELASAMWTPIVSSDVIRSEFSPRGDETDQDVNHQVWPELRRRVEVLLLSPSNVIIDATNAQSPDRKAMIYFLRQWTPNVIGIWMDTPLDECLRRNARRNKPRPPEALEAMHAYLWQGKVVRKSNTVSTPPALKEGLIGLWRVTPQDF